MIVKYGNPDGTVINVVQEIGGKTVVSVVQDTEAEWPDFVAMGPDAYDGPVASAPTLEDKRAAAYMSKRRFLDNVVAVGWITKEDRLSASRGEWPPSLASALDAMTAQQALDAQIAWAEASNVARTDWVVTFLADHLNITVQQLDALFGVQA